MKLLIVDDEARIRALIAKYAAFEGYETDEAENGMQAVEMCREKHYDLIIMDVMMPELDGFAALGAVIFALAFAMAWAFPAPEQGMARMGLLMPVFVLSGMGGFHFGPQGVLSGGVGLLCAALAVALVFTLAGRGEG